MRHCRIVSLFDIQGERLMHAAKTKHRWLRPLVVATLCLGTATAATAGGYKIYDIFHKKFKLPSVNYYGNLTYLHTKKVKFKVVINHYSKKVYAIGRGKVKNKSHQRQCFHNVGFINPYELQKVKWKRDILTVNRYGRCRGISYGKLKHRNGGRNNNNNNNNNQT